MIVVFNVYCQSYDKICTVPHQMNLDFPQRISQFSTKKMPKQLHVLLNMFIITTPPIAEVKE